MPEPEGERVVFKRGWGCLLISFFLCSIASAQETWPRHAIDSTSRGADGVKVADFNGDGLPDLVTGWEEGGQVALYLHPGLDECRQSWPKMIVGRVRSAEDAVFFDLDGRAPLEVVSCCEGKVRSVYLHQQQPGGTEWTTTPLAPLAGKAMWMFATPLDVNDDGQQDLVLGAKGEGAELGWMNGKRLQEKDGWTALTPVGWVMSIEAVDMNGDGRLDILFSDRKGSHRGVHWLEHPASSNGSWTKHTVGGIDREAMFLTRGDMDGDGLEDIACAVKDGKITWWKRRSPSGTDWSRHEVAMPPQTGSGKGIALLDLNGDKRTDILFTCEHSENKHGVGWLEQGDDVTSLDWKFHPISGDREGIKFDLIQLLDLDGDGDLDLVTCEERDNLGIIWYENPGPATR